MRLKAHQAFTLKMPKTRTHNSMSADAGMSSFAINDQHGNKRRRLPFDTRHRSHLPTTLGSSTFHWNGCRAHSPCSSKQSSKTLAHQSTESSLRKMASTPFQSLRKGSCESPTASEAGMRGRWTSYDQNTSMIWMRMPFLATICVHCHLFLAERHPRRGPSSNTAWQRVLQ